GESHSIEMVPEADQRDTPSGPEVSLHSVVIPSSNFNTTANNVESISAKIENTNSLYDSNEQLVFSRSTSDYSSFEGEQTSFWGKLILAIMLPYAIGKVHT